LKWKSNTEFYWKSETSGISLMEIKSDIRVKKETEEENPSLRTQLIATTILHKRKKITNKITKGRLSTKGSESPSSHAWFTWLTPPPPPPPPLPFLWLFYLFIFMALDWSRELLVRSWEGNKGRLWQHILFHLNYTNQRNIYIY